MKNYTLPIRVIIAGSLLAASGLLPPIASAVDVGTCTAPQNSYRVTRSDWVFMQPNGTNLLTWRCGSNECIAGGGYETRLGGKPGDPYKINVISDYPEDTRTWRVRLKNNDNRGRDVRIYAICAR